MKKLICWLPILVAWLDCASTIAAPPAAPQNIQEAWLMTETLLMWDDAPGATSYNVYRADDTNTTWTLVTSNFTVPRWRDNAWAFLPSYYVVTAVNGDGESAASDLATVNEAWGGLVTLPDIATWNNNLTPTNAIVYWYTSDSLGNQGIVEWGVAEANATNFNFILINTNYLPSQTFNLTNLAPLTPYNFRITSINPNRGGLSAIRFFITPDTNHPPVAENLTVWWPMPTNGYWLTLRGYDSNMPSPQSLTFRIVSGPTNGTLSNLQPGWQWNEASIVYTPVQAARGYDHFQFVVNNGTWDSAPGLVTVTNWFNTPPATTNGTVSTPEDTPLALTLPNFDAEGDPVTFDISPWAAWQGTISGTPPNVVFTPNTNFNGSSWFTYQVSDGYQQVSGWFQIEVTPVNDKPIINTNFFMGASTWEDYSTTLWLPINDVEWNSTYELLVVTNPLHGAISGDVWNIRYTPETNFFGADYFTLAIREPDGTTSDPVTLYVQVQSMDDAPVGSNSTVTVFEDTPQIIVPTAFDVEGDELHFQVYDHPHHGWVEQNGTNFIYHPLTNYLGSDTFSFWAIDTIGLWSWYPAWISIEVVDANDAPIADWSPYHLHTDIIVARPFNVTDLDGDAMVCEIVQQPLLGTVTVSGTNFTYTPEPGMSYYDVSFTYRATDGLLYSGEAPVTLWIDGTNSTPVAQDQSVTVRADETVLFQLFVQDIDLIESPTGIIDTTPAHGLVAFTNYSRAIYTPTNGFVGTDTFTYRPYDGFATGNLATVTITVLPPNLPPVASNSSVTGNEDTTFAINFVASDPNGDALTYELITTPTNGVLVGVGSSRSYTPVGNFNGGDSIRFRVFDGQYYSDVATISITVAAVNDAPVATNTTVLDYEDTPVTILLGGTDIDNSITACTFSIVTPPAHGTLGSGNRVRIYTPALNYNGPDSFTFQISDGSAVSGIATVSINVQPLNDPPSAPFQVITNYEDTTFPITLIGSDVDGDPITFSIMAQPYYGTLSGTPPNLVYKPNTNWNSGSPISVADFILFRVSDGTLVRSNTITIILLPVNDAPVANSQTRTMAEDTSLNITLIGSDVETNAMTFNVVSGPANGILSGTGSNRVYTPNPNFFGNDAFTFVASDATSNSTPATVSITVTAVQDAPVANAQSVTTVEDTALNITLSGSDPDGDVLIYSISSGPLHGALTGTVPNLVYTPAANYYGNDSFVFAVSDGTTNATATVSITVSPVNDLPAITGLRRRIYLDQVVRLWWPVVPGAESYRVYRATQSNGMFTLLVSGVTTTNFNDATAQWQQPYWYQVRTWDGAAEGQPSNPVFALPDSTGVVTLDVENWVIRSTSAMVQFYSTLPAGTEGLFEYGTSRDYTVFLENTNILPYQRFNLSNLTPATVYYFRVTATDSNGNAVVSSTNLYFYDWFVTDSPPVAFGQTNGTYEDSIYGPATGQLIGQDPNSPPQWLLTYSLVTQPSHGSVVLNADWYTYTPATNFFGTDSFTFKVNNGDLDSPPATVVIEVVPINDGPTVSDINVGLLEDTSIVVPITAIDVENDAIEYLSMGQPLHGTVQTDGINIIYTPNTNFFGTDQFSYEAIDTGFALGNTAWVHVTVTNVNDAPVANNQSRTTAEDTSLNITLTASDVDSSTLIYVIVTGPSHGTLSGVAPNVTYRPSTNFNGSDSFTFRATDTLTVGNLATVSINVTPVNDPPHASNIVVTLAEDTAVMIPAAFSDVDGGGAALGPPLEIISYSIHGAVWYSGYNMFYQPATNYSGPDSFTYRVTDGYAFGNTATVFVTVTNVNDAPVAISQSVTTAEDANKPITLTGSDADGDSLTFSIYTEPSQGSLIGTPPNVTYQPPANFNGTAQFTFRAYDGKGYSSPATVSITVTAANDRPVASAQSVSVDEDVAQAITLSGTDVDGDTLAYSVVTQPTHGTLSGTGANLTYTPAANYNGTDSFTFIVNDGSTNSVAATVSISVQPVNDAPVAQGNSFTLPEDGVLLSGITGSDLDGDALTYRITTPPSHGTLTISGSSSNGFTYHGFANYNGTDSFEFVANDGQLDSAPATISLTITPVNDTPGVTNQSVTVAEDSSVTFTPLAGDVDGDALTLTIFTAPAHGTAVVSGDSLIYTPAANYNGTDSFEYQAHDANGGDNTATVSVTIQPANDAPTANGQSRSVAEDGSVVINLTGSDLDGDTLSYQIVSGPTNGTLTGSAPNVTYTPNANYNGADSFTFRVNDGTMDSAAAAVSITVTPVNDAPVANAQGRSVTEDGSVAITLTGLDLEGSTLTYSIVSAPAHGTLSGIAPNITYTPAANYFGADSFSFKVNDGTADSATATVSITVTPVNDAPVANAQSKTTAEDTATSITLTGMDADGDTLLYSVLTTPAHGTLTGTAPNLTYTPAVNYFGSDSFTFRVNDSQVNGNTATVSITVNSVNDAPVANAQSVTAIYNTAKAVTLTGSDLEGGSLTYSIVNGPTNGTLSGSAPSLTYTPNVGSAGADFFTFRANDGSSNSAPAAVSITTQNPAGIPPAPTSLHVTVPTALNTLILDWSCSATNEDGFNIERSLSSGSGWSQIATTGINTLTFTNTGLTSGTRYYYRVRSYNRLGNSAYSNTVNQKPR